MRASGLRVLDLFSGIGGFSLGFERAGFKTIAFCESDPRCVLVLRDHWPHVPVFRDIGELHPEPGFIDVVCGGFPCQPFSTAARGRHPKKDLWPQFIRVVNESRPRWVVAENVSGIGASGTERVCRDLESAGYAVWPFNLDASLPQRQRGRQRIFWIAHSHYAQQPRLSEHEKMARLSRIQRQVEIEPGAVGVDDGLPGRVDRMRQLGNAVCPQIIEGIGHSIARLS